MAKNHTGGLGMGSGAQPSRALTPVWGHHLTLTWVLGTGYEASRHAQADVTAAPGLVSPWHTAGSPRGGCFGLLKAPKRPSFSQLIPVAGSSSGKPCLWGCSLAGGPRGSWLWTLEFRGHGQRSAGALATPGPAAVPAAPGAWLWEGAEAAAPQA